MNVPPTADLRQDLGDIPQRGLLTSGGASFRYRLDVTVFHERGRRRRPTLDELSEDSATWAEFERAILKRGAQRHERPLLRFIVECSDDRVRVSVIRGGLLDDGPWGVDVHARLSDGAASAADVRRWGQAVLAAADFADVLNEQRTRG